MLMLRSCMVATALIFGGTSAVSAADDNVSLVTVQGTGTVFAKPDCLHVNVAIVGEGASAAKAYTLNKEVSVKVFDAVKANKIEESDVNSVGFNFQRTYDEKGNPKGFQVVHRLSIKVKDIKNAGKLVDDLATSGGHLEGLQYVVTDRAEHMAKARALAVADAKSRADQIAKGLGTSVERVRNISEGSSYVPRGDVYAPQAATIRGESAGVQLAAGDQAITVNVNANFVLK